jgi:hypothetical protein
MAKKSVGPSTIKKNIKKESMHYFIEHKTARYIQRLAEMDKRPVGSYLDVLLEREARAILPAEEIDAIIQESEQKEAERLAQAQQMLEKQAAS